MYTNKKCFSSSMSFEVRLGRMRSCWRVHADSCDTKFGNAKKKNVPNSNLNLCKNNDEIKN